MKRLLFLGAAFCLVLGASVAIAAQNTAPVDPKVKPEQPAPTTPAPPKLDGVAPQPNSPGVTVDNSKLGKNVHQDTEIECGTTDCAPSFCFDDNGGQDTCHHESGGSCSGNINTGYKKCQDGPITRVCPGNQKVHLQNCACACLGNACGTHVVFLDCE